MEMTKIYIEREGVVASFILPQQTLSYLYSHSYQPVLIYKCTPNTKGINPKNIVNIRIHPNILSLLCQNTMLNHDICIYYTYIMDKPYLIFGTEYDNLSCVALNIDEIYCQKHSGTHDFRD